MPIKVSVKPYQRITIRSVVEYDSPQAFVDAITLHMPREIPPKLNTIWLYWANSVLFRHFPYPPTDSVTREYLIGHFPIDNLEYCTMPTYSKEISSGAIFVPVIDVSNHLLLSAVAGWIADRLRSKARD
jgi:hypothetical protein